MLQADSVRTPVEVQSRPSPTGFRADIEGLRGVTLLAILGFHAEVPGVGGGFVGPDIFFIISGFVITGQLWREVDNTGTVGLRRFYGARARRLLPVSATVGLVTMLAAFILLPPLLARTVMYDGVASALYVPNFWFIAEGVDYFGGHLPPSPFQHYWTLGVEEQFYLVWPVMIVGWAWLIRRARRRTKTDAGAPSSKRPYLVLLALIAGISFALSLATTYVMPSAAYFSLPTRAWDLAAGGLVAFTAVHWRRLPALPAAIIGWAGLALILVVCSELPQTTPYPGIAAVLPMLGTVLVIGAGCATSKGCGRVLAWSPMRAIGRVSYSWYLWHWPVLVLAPVLLGHPLGLAGRLAAVVVSGGMGVLTLRFIENPLRYAGPLRRSPLRSLSLGGAATVLAACVGVVLLVWVPIPVGRGAPVAPLSVTAAAAHPLPGSNTDAYDAAVQRVFTQMHAAVEASAERKAVPSNLNPSLADAGHEQDAFLFHGCVRDFFEGGQPECATGDTASKTTVALVGDSHAAMLNPAFQQIAGERPWRLEIMSKAGCLLLDVPINNPSSRLVERFRHCVEWRDQIITRLRAEHPKLIVVSMWRRYGAGVWQPGFTPYDPTWIKGLTHLVQELRGSGSKVLVLGPFPDPQTVVPVCLSGHLDDATACAPSRSTALNAAGIAAESAATQAAGGQYVDLSELFCTTKRCPVIVGNTLMFFDWSHLTREYSRLLTPVLLALADRALAHPVDSAQHH